MRNCCLFQRILFVVFSLQSITTFAIDRQEPPRRAKPPHWSPEVLDTFFDDAREQLVGKRPEKQIAKVDASDSTGKPEAAARFQWSQWIDADVLVTEIKRLQKTLAADLKSPGQFKSGGFKQCRLDFSMLAVLFAVVHQYDEEVRWQRDAAALRDRFARTGLNCKVASDGAIRDGAIGDGAFAEAISRRDQLEALIRGNRSRMDKPADPEGWDKVADLPVLMQRMELSHEERISPQLGSSQVFRKGAKEVHHEAQLLAMLAEIISREGYEYWDDDAYAQYARQLRDAAVDLGRASSEQNYGLAREAAGRVGQACSGCHEDYRG